MAKRTSPQMTPIDSRRQIVELPHDDARAFLLKPESYATLDMPAYFKFGPLLQDVAAVLESEPLARPKRARNFDAVNHRLLTNKDGRHAWRPIDLLHPALYVAIVNEMTRPDKWEEVRSVFQGFQADPRIQCLSLPVSSLSEQRDKAEQVKGWLLNVEQKSIELSLEYDFVVRTDIIDCYSSVYTHSIPWAVHTRSVAKKNKNDLNLVGNFIDDYLQSMNEGQTNGIPQGSVLMDFFAEMVLGYSDSQLGKVVHDNGIRDYRILRYRDDYRIFVNSKRDGETVLKCLTEVLIELGLKLNPGKTFVSDDVIQGAIKADKLEWMLRGTRPGDLRKHMLAIREHSKRHPNSGSVTTEMTKFYQRVVGIKEAKHEDALSLIAIATDIAYKNPKVYPIVAAILSKLLSLLGSADERNEVVGNILQRFARVPNIGHLEIWLQRISYPFGATLDFEERLCHVIEGCEEVIWENAWLGRPQLQELVDGRNVVDWEELEASGPIVAVEEVALFRETDYLG